MYKKLNYLLLVLCCLLLFSCTQKTYKVVYPTLHDGKYDSEFPYKSCSQQISILAQCVKKIMVHAEYKTFYFSPNDKILKKQLQENLKKNITQGFSNSETVSGTATILSATNNRIVMITCAHVVNFPDTIFDYYDSFGFDDKYLRSVSVKLKRYIHIKDLPLGEDIEIICQDIENDIAFVVKRIYQTNEIIPVFPYPMGKANELEWGSFVYILGYPQGIQMLTKGIVSNPPQNSNNVFFIDALFNKGISGGIILAIRDGVPNFEWVGIAKSAYATNENILKPQLEYHEQVYNPKVPYKGEVFVGVRKDINYGITYSTPIEKIKECYFDNRNKFLQLNCNLDHIFQYNQSK